RPRALRSAAVAPPSVRPSRPEPQYPAESPHQRHGVRAAPAGEGRDVADDHTGGDRGRLCRGPRAAAARGRVPELPGLRKREAHMNETADATKYRIHPAIGVARLGNSPKEFCIAPEKPAALPIECDASGNAYMTPDGAAERAISKFKDAEGRI